MPPIGSWGDWLRRPSVQWSARDERPNRNAFTSLKAARRIIEACDDNLVHSHSSFGRLCFAQHVNRLVRGNGRTA
jgi:hypothetical protein